MRKASCLEWQGNRIVSSLGAAFTLEREHQIQLSMRTAYNVSCPPKEMGISISFLSAATPAPVQQPDESVEI